VKKFNYETCDVSSSSYFLDDFFLSEYLCGCITVSFIGRKIHVGVRGEDRLGGNGRDDVFIDDQDHVTFPTGGIKPAESAQLPGILTSHKHNGERNSTFFFFT